MSVSQNNINDFQDEILSWYEMNQRELPWRKTRDPYSILVSEVMSQQTQIARVVPKYLAWMERFPTVQSLASAETSDVLRYWSGLGYNRRALYLQKTARAIAKEHNGIWPRTVSELKKLPGIGDYTAAAVACFAFDQQIAVVDTNVRKVILTKLHVSAQDHAMTNKELQEIANHLLPQGRAYEWNQALMDYASMMLKQEKIPIKKQSKFKESNRYYRGQTVKLLIKYKEVSIKYLGESLGKDELFIEKIINGLEKDGLVKRRQNIVSIA